MRQDVLEMYAAEFDRCAEFLRPSVERYSFGNHDMGDLKAFVMAGKMQLWPGERSALLTEIVQHPARTGCHVAYGGGDLDELRAMAPRIREWARSVGCDHLTCAGRKGWARALGFGTLAYTVCREDI